MCFVRVAPIRSSQNTLPSVPPPRFTATDPAAFHTHTHACFSSCRNNTGHGGLCCGSCVNSRVLAIFRSWPSTPTRRTHRTSFAPASTNTSSVSFTNPEPPFTCRSETRTTLQSC